MYKKIFVYLVFLVLIHICYGQELYGNKGISASVFAGQVKVWHEKNVTYVNDGSQYGLRIGLWASPYFSLGMEGVLANDIGDIENLDYNRLHVFAGYYPQFFKYINPYVMGSMGLNSEPENIEKSYNNLSTRFAVSIKAGMVLNVHRYRIAIECGGGTMGTDHLEINVLFGYMLRKLP